MGVDDPSTASPHHAGDPDLVPVASAGVLVAPFGDAVAAYDLASDLVHVLDPAAGWILGSSGLPIAELAREVSDEIGIDVEQAAADIRAGIEVLVAREILGRTTEPRRPDPLPDGVHSHSGGLLSKVHAVLDEGLVFHGDDPELLAEIDACLGLADDREATIAFDAFEEPDGRVSLLAVERWDFPDRAGFLRQLPGIVHDRATHDRSMLVLHAGGARTPDGRVIVLPGLPEAGKSTLTSALVMAGSDHLGDETVGIREERLGAVGMPGSVALDSTSRDVLGIIDRDGGVRHLHATDLRADATSVFEAGPVDEVILPVFDPEVAEPVAEALRPADALRLLLTATMNLAWARDAAWATLCRLAVEVPVAVVRHPDAPSLARVMIDAPLRSWADPPADPSA